MKPNTSTKSMLTKCSSSSSSSSNVTTTISTTSSSSSSSSSNATSITTVPNGQSTTNQTITGGGGGPSQVKCVFIGDGAIGKTSLIVSYTTNGYPSEYVPTAFDTYSVVVTIDNKPCQLQLCDTAGQDDFDSIRPLCYNYTDVFLVCFSVVSPVSFHNIRQKWLPEIRRAITAGHTTAKGHKRVSMPPFILIGTQCDLRHDVKVLIELDSLGEQPISSDYARSMAKKLGAICYIECSALTQKNLKEVFDAAIIAGLDYQSQVKLVPHPSNPKGKLSTSANRTNVPQTISKSKQSNSQTPNDLNYHHHHFVPTNRTKGANISDAKLVGWRKSLTKLSAKEVMQKEAMHNIDDSCSTVLLNADDCEIYSAKTVSSSSVTDSCLTMSTSATTMATSSLLSGKNCRTIVKSKRSNVKSKVTPKSSIKLSSDQEDDQGFHDDVEVESTFDEDNEHAPINLDDRLCLNGDSKSNCHYYYHQNKAPVHNQRPHRQVQQKLASSPDAAVVSRVHDSVTPTNKSNYYYFYQNRPLPTPLSQSQYFDPYLSSAHYGNHHHQSTPVPVEPIYQTTTRPPTTAARLQSFFHLNRPTSSSSTAVSSSATSTHSSSNQKVFAPQTNLATTLRSSSFFFLPSNTLKKKNQKKLCKSESSSASSDSSSSSSRSNSLFKNNNTSTACYHGRSELFQMMSNSVTELRNRKSSIFKLFSTSSSSSSSTNYSRSSRSSSSSNREKSTLKSKKLKDLYYYSYDSDDYEEIEIQKRNKCLFCCFPF